MIIRYRLRVERLHELLAESRLSQNHWAIKLGLSRGHWSDLVNGKHAYPSQRTRERLTEAFGVAFDYLFEQEAETPDGEAAFKAAVGNRYLIDREIGQGGMGVVYLARDVRHGRAVALKMVSPEAVSGIGPRQFLKEIRYTARLQHPNILPLFDSGVAADRPYYVTPYITGGSLRDLLKRSGHLPLTEALVLLRGIGRALSHAHDLQVLHCDMKPENVLITGDHAFVADFGIARAIHSEIFEWGPRRELDSSAGTPAYVSPEQASGEQQLDARSDVYSLACVAFEMLAGEPPFTGSNTMEIVSQRFTSRIPDVREFNPDVPAAVANVIARGMSLPSARRPETVAAFIQAMEAASSQPTDSQTMTVRAVRAAVRAGRHLAHRVGATRPGVTMDSLWSDLRFAVRSIRRRPGMSTLAALTLALGIGACTAMFSVVNSVLLRPLEYPEPERVVSIYPTRPSLRGHEILGELAERATFSWPEFFAVRDRRSVFTAVGAYRSMTGTVTGHGRPEQVPIAEANWELFSLLGATPIAGRLFTADDDTRGGADVVLLTEGFWRERYAADPSVVGQTITIDDRTRTIVGILPSSFRVGTLRPRLWFPRTPSASDNWQNHNISGAVARLAPGVTVDQAREALTNVLAAAAPPDHDAHGGSVFPRRQDETRRSRRPLLILIAASFMLLGVACGNVAAIQLSSGIDREQELAVRGALGASRPRIVRQLLTENVAIALVGAAGGIGAAVLATRFLVYLAPPGLPRLDAIGIDITVLGFAVGLGGLCGILFGLAPALGMSERDPGRAITSSRGTTSARVRLHQTLVVAELALATVLMVAGALLARSLAELNRVDPGFDHDNLLAIQIATPFQRFTTDSGTTDLGAFDTYVQEIVDQVSALPNVDGVATTTNVPLTRQRANNGLVPEGWESRNDESLIAERRFTSVNYFDVMRIPLIEGRFFDARDDRGDAAPTMIISEGLARYVWPNASAIGKRIEYFGSIEATVIGVVSDLRDETLDASTGWAFYVPARQQGALRGGLMVRISGEWEVAAEAIRQRIWTVDPDLPITQMTPVAELMSESIGEQRYRARLIAVFAVMAGVFAVLGIYGVTARSVNQRSREIAIRIALGAERRTVVRMIVRQGTVLALIGGGVGIGLAIALGGYVRDFLFRVSVVDPMAIGGIALFLGVTSVIATLGPARRATRVDPMEVMRVE